jgi:hypothetical protein
MSDAGPSLSCGESKLICICIFYGIRIGARTRGEIGCVAASKSHDKVALMRSSPRFTHLSSSSSSLLLLLLLLCSTFHCHHYRQARPDVDVQLAHAIAGSFIETLEIGSQVHGFSNVILKAGFVSFVCFLFGLFFVFVRFLFWTFALLFALF